MSHHIHRHLISAKTGLPETVKKAAHELDQGDLADILVILHHFVKGDDLALVENMDRYASQDPSSFRTNNDDARERIMNKVKYLWNKYKKDLQREYQDYFLDFFRGWFG